MNEQQYSPPPMQSMMPQNSTLAIISLIAGIVSFILLPFLAAIAAVVTGHLAKKQIRESNGMVTGNGMATAGLVLGYINLGLVVCGCLVWAVFFIWAMVQGNSSYSY
jgi:hypothetical protein